MSYTAQIESTLRILSRRGLATPLTRVVPGIKDAVNQNATPSTTQTQQVQIAVLPATVARDATLEDRALFRSRRRMLYIAGLKPDGSTLDFEPDDQQTVVFEGATWRLVGVSRLSPDGGAPILFTAEAAR